MLWFVIAILVIVLIYIVSEHTMQVRRRKQQLEQIQKRLAEKQAESSDEKKPDE